MIGAIIGDIIGSPFEFHNIKTKDFPLFCDKSCFTDDTILTCAVAEGLTKKKNAQEMLLKWGKHYIKRTYENGTISAFGKGFTHFLETKQPYHAKSNGCLMRLSPFFNAFQNKDDAIKEALKWTVATHNHAESIKATKAYIETGFLLRHNIPVSIIKNAISQKYNYNLFQSIDEIRFQNNKFDVLCERCLPQAIICSLDAISFEDAVRNAISIGGDSDTLAAITGGLAEIRFEIPQNIRKLALQYLDKDILRSLNAFEKRFCHTSDSSAFLIQDPNTNEI